MNPTRLFVLGALARHGPMYGHQIRRNARMGRADLWSDVRPGSLYGALHRLEAEGLIVTVRTEQPGNLPARTVYAITAEGQRELRALRAEALTEVGPRPDPVDLALVMSGDLDADVLRAEVQAIAAAAQAAEVEIVGGDTKVVQRGLADGMYLCTTGVGAVDLRAHLATDGIRPGDQILVSGPIGEHGSAIMLARDQFDLDAEVESDTCCLWPAVDVLLDAVGGELHCLRDATRGGVASVLNELARASGVSMVVREADVPVSPVVGAAAELLGIDPMYIANEGRLVAFVAPEAADAALAALRTVPGSEHAAAIGEARTKPPGMVMVQTAFGGRRVMDQLVGDPLPRIC